MTARVSVATFLDPLLEDELAGSGYAVGPFLDVAEVAHIREAYRAIVPEGDHGLTVDYMRPDRRVMADIAELLAPVWTRHFPEVFFDHRPVFATFVTKHPGEASAMFFHEDRTFVDERFHRAGTLWIPLVDVGPGLVNGGLEVLPGSHRLTTSWSGTNTPELFRPFEAALRSGLQRVAVSAGSALYYDTRTLHASPANLSNEPREAIVCAVAPCAAELIHVVGTSKRHRCVHRVDTRFFLEVHPHAIDQIDPDEYPLIAEFDDDARLTAADIEVTLGLRAPVAEQGGPLIMSGAVVRSPGRVPLRHDDPPLSAADLPVPDGTADVARLGFALTVLSGAAGVVELASRSGLVDPFPGWAEYLRGAIADDRVVTAVVLDPHTKVGVHVPGRAGTRWRVDVVDVAPAAAGVVIGEHEVPLHDGDGLEISAQRDAEVWNNGPGVLVLLIDVAVPSDPWRIWPWKRLRRHRARAAPSPAGE